jgi:rhamnogalacturonan endolyase
MDAKYYQFWVRGNADGTFSIPNVRPGKWALHAFADGVLGEFAKTDIVMEPGKQIDLGKLEWTPVRFGKQLWEIGVPNRTGSEFKHGDDFWHWGLYNEYPKDFPNDVNFVIGQSNWKADWNYAQCPLADRPEGTPWTITFELPEAPKGRAILRVALAATSARRVDVEINNKATDGIGPLQDNATIRRDGIHGTWFEKDVTFDAVFLHAGKNTVKLTVPAGNPMSGVIYDYIRLELDEKGNL